MSKAVMLITSCSRNLTVGLWIVQYDGRIFAQAQMAAAYVYLIKEMLTARWISNDKILDIEDITEIVYRFSRELEHSDKNLMTWEAALHRRLW